MEVAAGRGPFNRSVRELNNKNNLASLRLKKTLAGFDRERKLLVEHLDKDKVDTYHFLQQLQLCESNMVPGYKLLLEGIISRPNMARRRERKAHTAPSASGGAAFEQDVNATSVKKKFVPKFTKAQIQLLQTGRTTDAPANHDQADAFFRKLHDHRFKEMEIDAALSHDQDHDLIRKFSRLSSVAEESGSGNYKWASPRGGSGFQSIERISSVGSRHRPRDYEGPSLSVAQTIPELVPLRHAPLPSTAEDDVFRTSTQRQSRTPLDQRLNAFYDKLDVMKRRQDELIAGRSQFEKRRRWMNLTKGEGGDFDEQSDDDTFRYT